MTKNSKKHIRAYNSFHSKSLVLGRLIVFLVVVLAFAAEIFAQDYQMTLNPRRLGNQLGVEVWIKTLNPNAVAIGDITVPVKYNGAYLTGAPQFDNNQPSSKTDGVINDADIASPYYIIESDFHNKNGFSNLHATVTESNNDCIATLSTILNPNGDGFVPADTGNGSFVGMLRINIKNVALTDDAYAEFDFNSGNTLGEVKIMGANGSDLTTSVELVPLGDFTVRGIKILNPNSFQTVNRYPATPYASMGNNFGYPIYFERSGLATPSKTDGVYGTPRYAYKIEYSVNDGATYTETGRVAENRLRNAQMITNADHNANHSGMVDFYDGTIDYYVTTGAGNILPTDVASGADLEDRPDGPGLESMGYGGVLRVIWKGDPNFPYRSEQARLKITQLTTVPASSNTDLSEETRPSYTDLTRRGVSDMSFVLGRIFFVQLNGECQYLRSERIFYTPSAFTVEAWINLNGSNGEGTEPAIVAASSGSASPEEGGWMLYLQDGIYPAFRVRAADGGYVGVVQSPKALTPYGATNPDGSVVIDKGHSENWTHIAAVVNSNTVSLYVDGEQVAQYVNTTSANVRPMMADMPIWVGVNPNNNFETGVDFLNAGIKEVKLWRTPLTQEQLRQYTSGVPFPTRASDTSKALGTIENDPKVALELYFNLQGVRTDLATDAKYQWGSNPLNYYVACNDDKANQADNLAIYYRPDGSHIKITSPSCGEGVSNLKGKIYEVRWVSYGIGSSLPTSDGGAGDIMIQVSRDGGQNWFDAIGENRYDEATGGTFAVSLDNEEVESGSAIWEPYNNVTLTGIANDIQGVIKIDSNYVKTARLRVSGTEARMQQDIYAESQDFVVAPHFALINKPTTRVTISGSPKLNVTTQNAYMEAWIKPYSFPQADGDITSYPIIVKKNADALTDEEGLHYALRLEPTGQLSFSFASYDSTTGIRDIRTAYSDINKAIPIPNVSAYDSLWYHVGVYLNIPPNGTVSAVTFYIDGIPQNTDSIKRQLGEGIISESKNTFPTYLGYEPFGATEQSYFDGEMREVRFWRNNPGGFNSVEIDDNQLGGTTKKLDNFIQGALTVRSNELVQVGSTNYAQGLIAAYSMDGGSWVNNGVDQTISVYPSDPDLQAQIFAECGDRLYAATYPLIKLVEPQDGQQVANTDTVRVRWVGFDYNRNDVESFTVGLSGANKKRPDLGISDDGGSGSSNEFYPEVASVYHNTAFRNSMILPTQINPFEFQGTPSKSQFAALIDLSVANPDVKGNLSYDEQGPVPSSQKNARLQLFARANINSPSPLEYYANGEDDKDGIIKTLMSQSARFSITPPSNFTVRVLLEGYHQGLETGIVGRLDNTAFENNALRIRFYQNNANYPGEYIPNSMTINKDNYSASAKNPVNRGNGTNDFANVRFTLPEVIDGKYFVVVDHQNYLPIMSAFPAEFFFKGDDLTTWSIESGWDFQGWDGVNDKMQNADNSPVVFGSVFSAFMNEVPSADYLNSAQWTLTPLNFNEGHAKKGSTDNSLAAMVGGDVVRDGEINASDRTAIRENSMSYSPQYDLKGYGAPNAIDRTIVYNNTGKVSSLRDIASITNDVYPKAEEENGIIAKNRNPLNVIDKMDPENSLRVLNDIKEYQRKANENDESENTNNVKAGETFQAGVDYLVTATPHTNGNYVDVPIYIQNIGDKWSMANASFPIEFDPAVVRFKELISDNVIFSNNNTLGYGPSYFAPTSKTIDPVANTYSIEIDFEYSFAGSSPIPVKPGENVPTTRTYLGTLRFDMLTNDENIIFRWSPYAAVLAVDGRDLTGDGTFEEIPPIIFSKKVEIVSPNGGEKLDGGSTNTITWRSPYLNTNVYIQYTTDNGSNWTTINHTPVAVTLCSYIWNVPFINSDQCRVRLVNSVNEKDVLTMSAGTFTINVAPTEITRPVSSDPMYVANSKDYIKWFTGEQTEVYFEFSANGTTGWTKVTEKVHTSAGEIAWTLPNVTTCDAYVRMVYAQSGKPVEGAISGPFKIGVGSVALSNPKKGDSYDVNTKVQIKWTSKIVTTFDVQFSTDAGANWTTVVEKVDAAKKVYNWTTPNVSTSNAMIRVVSSADNCLEYNRTGTFAVGKVSVDEDEIQISGNAIAGISPNPATDIANLKINLVDDSNVTISIYDVRGLNVASIVENSEMTAGTHNLSFNVSDLSSGVYIIRMQVGTTIITKEFIKIQ